MMGIKGDIINAVRWVARFVVGIALQAVVTLIAAIILILIIGMFCSCGKLEDEYSTYQCYFYFDTTTHPASLIKAVTNPLSPGTYAMVTKQTEGSVMGINVSLYGGQSDTDKILTEAELRRSYILGVSNSLIIGCSTMANGTLYAYDRQCPNCFVENYPTAKYPLQWDASGQWVKCTTCNRSYDLNGGGYVVSGTTGQKLLRYRANYDGSVLRVQNK